MMLNVVANAGGLFPALYLVIVANAICFIGSWLLNKIEKDVKKDG